MAGPVAESDKLELEAHAQAYLRIFQAVLSKKAGDPAQKQAVLGRLNSYLRQNITTLDAFIDHIPQFSKALGVPEPALGNFIGANFIRALNQVKDETRKKAGATVSAPGASGVATAAPGSGPAPAARDNEPKKSDRILDEIARRFGVVIEAGGVFQSLDDGLMKLVTPSGEVLPASLTGGSMGPAEAAPSGNGGAAPAAAATDAKPAPKPAAPATKAAPTGPLIKEKLLLTELLEKFGNVLDIPGKLEPAVWEEEGAEGNGEPGPVAAPAVQAPERAAIATPAPKKATPAGPLIREKLLLTELLEKFGNVLDIPGKLEPSVWEDEEGGGGGAPTDAGLASAEYDTSGADASPSVFDRIPMTFGEYATIQKKIQAFQASGDQSVYRAWLNNEAGLPGKAMIGLRNLDNRERNSGGINWQDEYANLAVHLGVDVRQVEDFHLRMKYFIRIQQHINQLTHTIKSQGPALLGAAQKIWPQVLQIFHNPGDAGSYRSQLKIILLQIPDPALKEKMVGALGPVFDEVAAVYEDLDH